MKKNNFDRLLKNIGICQETLDALAFDSGLVVRKRMVSASELLYSFCLESTNGIVSYNDVAAHIDAECGVSVSRQAIWKKSNDACIDFFKAILAHTIMGKIKAMGFDQQKSSLSFNRLLVQDSTIIKLPTRLFEIFSGVSNGQAKVCNARIQGVYDILNEKFIEFSIDPYTKNDLKAAPETELKEGDLSLRDRGYLITDEIQRHKDNMADCIYRHKFGMVLLDETSEKPINLLEILKKNCSVDINVKLNNKQKTTVRLVAQPVSKRIADERRRKAKKEKKLHLQRNTWNCSHGRYL